VDEGTSILVGDTDLEDWIRDNIKVRWHYLDAISEKKYRVTIEEIDD
jgi:hypothetical protein